MSNKNVLVSLKAEMRGLLPKRLLDTGFFSVGIPKDEGNIKNNHKQLSSYGWSGELRCNLT